MGIFDGASLNYIRVVSKNL